MAIKIEKQTSIIIFYILYFVWLTLLTFLTPDPTLINYFTAGIVVFYFIFLSEPWDIIFFLLAGSFVVIGSITKFENWDIKINYQHLTEIQYWLPLAWGTTAVALRKFYKIMSRRGTM